MPAIKKLRLLMTKHYLMLINFNSITPILLKFTSIFISFLVFSFSAKILTKQDFGIIIFLLSVSSILALYLSYGVSQKYQYALSINNLDQISHSDNFIKTICYLLVIFLIINIFFLQKINLTYIILLSISLLLNRYITADYIGSGKIYVSQISEIFINTSFLIILFMNMLTNAYQYIFIYTLLIFINFCFLWSLSNNKHYKLKFLINIKMINLNLKDTKFFLGILIGPFLSDLYLSIMAIFHEEYLVADLRILQRFFWFFIIINSTLCNWNFKNVMKSNNKIKAIGMISKIHILVSFSFFVLIFFFIKFFLLFIGNQYLHLENYIKIISFFGIFSSLLFNWCFFCIYLLDKKIYYKYALYCFIFFLIIIIISISTKNLLFILVFFIILSLAIPLPSYFLLNKFLLNKSKK